jgi:hypothetical protein
MFLGCGKRMKDGRKIILSEANTSLKTLESDGMTSERTLEMVPPKNELNNIASGGKRLLEGGLDSPSKRARKYIELKDFWGGGGG